MGPEGELPGPVHLVWIQVIAELESTGRDDELVVFIQPID
jgi:hypothetical protein